MRLLSSVLAALTLGALAAPVTADPLADRGIHHDRVEAAAAYFSCLLPDGGGSGWCLVAERAAGTSSVTVTVRSLASGAQPSRSVHPDSALTVSASTGTVRLLATVPDVGRIDVTSVAEATRGDLLVNDLCARLPMHVELRSPTESLAYAYRTTGSVAGTTVHPFHVCTTVLALGPVSGLWRMAGGL